MDIDPRGPRFGAVITSGTWGSGRPPSDRPANANF
jgi:hypothetical protein